MGRAVAAKATRVATARRKKDDMTQQPKNQPPPTRLLSPTELARYLGVDPRTLRRWRHNGTGPAYLVIGKQIRYAPAAIQHYLQAQTVRPSTKKPSTRSTR